MSSIKRSTIKRLSASTNKTKLKRDFIQTVRASLKNDFKKEPSQSSRSASDLSIPIFFGTPEIQPKPENVPELNFDSILK